MLLLLIAPSTEPNSPHCQSVPYACEVRVGGCCGRHGSISLLRFRVLGQEDAPATCTFCKPCLFGSAKFWSMSRKMEFGCNLGARILGCITSSCKLSTCSFDNLGCVDLLFEPALLVECFIQSSHSELFGDCLNQLSYFACVNQYHSTCTLCWFKPITF